MKSSDNYKKVRIHITTYIGNKESRPREMEQNRIYENNKLYICSLCLNPNINQNVPSCATRFAKLCPICHKKCTCDHTKERKDAIVTKPREIYAKDKNPKALYESTNKEVDTKVVQTSHVNLTQDLSLLKEVLTVFQNKKIDEKSSSKTIMKDVSIETESKSNTELKPQLTKSKIFQVSIENGNREKGDSFKVVHYCQPNKMKSSRYSIDVVKLKSSSIPQMKLEELKYSLKEKTRSKDAIEEVNRMFATVKRNDMTKSEDQNRPKIRSGPRVLPVVKTKDFFRKDNSDNEEEMSDDKTKIYEANSKKSSYCGLEDQRHGKPSCKCCQTNKIRLSAGDSFVKHECCYHKVLCEGKCEKCVYMMCCHHQRHNKVETGALICECCNNGNEE